MQSFCFFVAYLKVLLSVAKEVGVWGLVPTNNKTKKIILTKYSYILNKLLYALLKYK
ncbi:hypothetical protein BPP43_04680 [Brachyspira pilosicoli P43/6/78]|uniref:Uncharacterized protein n=1 Tax=Brachyspira pilosicoli P43/6/78 TaxID=1042417 RepID=A0A3B6VKA2_BRAPL|nr:hypothetical protein BPP43_04680 [Brachyspira pilosicoli P43/6/78]